MKKLLPLLVALTLPVAALAQPVVVAKRGEGTVTMADIDTRMSEIPMDKRAGFIDSPQRIDQMVGQLLLVKQLAAEARKEHLENDPEYQAKLALAQARLLAEARMRQLASEPLEGDAQQSAKEIYLANPERFQTGEVSVVRYFMAKDEAAAKAVQARVQKGEDFEAIVRAESLDRDSANNGGMIEIGKESRVLPDVVLAAKNMKTKGEFAVVPTSNGAALLQFVERRGDRKRTFEEVQSLLVNEANIKRRDAHLKGHLDKLQNLPIEAERETVASLRTRYPNGEIPAYGSR